MSLAMQSQKCIWMECGYVEYKLCDRNFDCENCPFDQAMKKEKSENNSTQLLVKEDKERNLIFTLNHIWLEPKNNTVTLGIDDFAQSMFNKNCSICFPGIGERLVEGKTFLWFVGSFGAVGFQSPIEGYVVWINSEIKEKPYKFFEGNSFDIELVKIRCEDFNSLNIYSYQSYEDLVKHDNKLIKEFLIQKFSYPNLPDTLPDGGELIQNYLKVLNSRDYYQLLKLLFNKKYREN